MTGAKVILTYKRQRPPHLIAYKRKKQPSRKDFSQDNQCRDTSAESPNYNSSATTEKLDGSTEENKSECPINNDPTPAEKQEEPTEGNKSEYPSCNIPTTAQKQEESTEGNRSGCPAKNYEVKCKLYLFDSYTFIMPCCLFSVMNIAVVVFFCCYSKIFLILKLVRNACFGIEAELLLSVPCDQNVSLICLFHY